MTEHSPAPEVRCRGLTVSFADVPILDHLNLVVPPGKITTLVGSSGAGKSTLMKLLLGILMPQEGVVTIGGHDIWNCTEAQLHDVRAELSALHGGSTLFDGSIFTSLTIRENLLAVLYEKHSGAQRGRGSNPYLRMWSGGPRRKGQNSTKMDAVTNALHQRAGELLERFDLVEVADQLPDEVAARTRRRAALARALAVDVRLYLLDDFDTAMDTPHRDRIVSAILDTQRRTGATMLVTTHDLALAQRIGDSMAILADRRIVEHGPPAEVATRAGFWYRRGSAER